jgi:hypothetical protein
MGLRISVILLRAGALRRIGIPAHAKQDALRSFSEGGLSKCIMSILLKVFPTKVNAM